ncbi:lysophospholipid acyltransferase family protein [Lacticigenium naphthae]|uniref:lysophospholipid acyltransferase family protein n=1 Tax=Lacticigenium naphthae TaxID=515351 RepID=UPI00041940AC|nr:1-acyl-sn-glycerol-3-phosphate acyltransferase [Lacticigenium naphthae]
MFYTFLKELVRFILLIINGKPEVKNKAILPQDDNYILAAPHKSWLDPIYIAIAASPKKFSFMAKEELFKNPIMKWILTHMNAFSVSRKNPGPSAIKIPVKILKETNLGLIIFPSGSRHSEDLKGGTLTIAKLSGKPIIPVVYSGPLTFKDLFTRKKTYVVFGEPIHVERKIKLNKETISEYSEQLQNAFDSLNKE